MYQSTEFLAVFIIAIAFAVTYFIIPKILWVVYSRDLIDKPDARSSHATSTPTMAGVSFFLAIICVIFLIKTMDSDNVGMNLIAALSVIFIIGLKDDLVVSSPRAKLMGQLMASCALLSNPSFQEMQLGGFLGVNTIPLYVVLPILLFLILAIINAYNLLDGIDGLASMIGIVIFSAFAVLFYLTEAFFYFLVAVGFIGMLFAYLRYNFSSSKKIFMGDTGSLIIGFCIAFLTVKYVNMDLSMSEKLPFFNENKVPVMLAILALPLFDTLRVIGIRLLQKKSPFYPDRNHIHHILIDAGLKHYKASLFLAVLNCMLIGFVVFCANIFSSYAMVAVVVLLFLLLLFLFYRLKENNLKGNSMRGLIGVVNFFF